MSGECFRPGVCAIIARAYAGQVFIVAAFISVNGPPMGVCITWRQGATPDCRQAYPKWIFIILPDTA
ncbi:MAG: hypothetical protein WC342_01970 [Methanoregula sp.]